MLTKTSAVKAVRDANQARRLDAELRWRRARLLPKRCGILLLTAIVALAALPFFQLGPFAPIVAGLITLVGVLAMIVTNVVHRAAFMDVQKCRGIREDAAKRAYAYNRPFASAA